MVSLGGVVFKIFVTAFLLILGNGCDDLCERFSTEVDKDAFLYRGLHLVKKETTKYQLNENML